jgi:hypothetical protein
MTRRRTLTGGWNQSGDHSKFTLPILMFDAVPTGQFGCGSDRDTPGSLEVGVDGGLDVGEDDGLGILEGDTRQ